MIVEWDCPFQIESQFGTLDLNTSSGDRYVLDRGECDAGADLRVSTDNAASRDGGTIHNPFSSWYGIRLSASLWVDNEPACGADLNRMIQTLQLHLLGMKHVEGRLWFTPSGFPQRLADNVRLTSRLTHTLSSQGVQGQGEGTLSVVTWAFSSPFPYVITAAQNSTEIGIGTSPTTAVLVNDGDTDFWPVFQVEGTVGAFTITNTTTGLAIVYSSGFPGGSVTTAPDYIEIDCFKETLYVNGDGGNRKAGVSVPDSDFFTLIPGNNTITFSGGTGMTVLYNDAWG